MAGKNWLTYAPEGEFNQAPVAGWTDIEVTDLGAHAPIVAVQQSEGMVRGQIGPSQRGRRNIIRGGAGTIKPYLATRGMLGLFAAAIGEPDIEAVGPVNRHRFDLDAVQPTTTLAVQIGREFKGGAQDFDTFTGGQPTTLKMSQGLSATQSGTSSDGIPSVEMEMGYVGFPTVAEVESVHAESVNFAGGDFQAWVAPTLAEITEDECFNEFGIEIPTGLTGDPCIAITSDKAGRAGLLAPTLQLGRSYKDRLFYDAWINGTPMAFRCRWAVTIDEFPFAVTIEVPSMSFTGDVPTESQTEVTKQTLPAAIESVLGEDDEPLPLLSVIVDTDEEWDTGS